jgi:hypothetical protein
VELDVTEDVLTEMLFPLAPALTAYKLMVAPEGLAFTALAGSLLILLARLPATVAVVSA